MALGLAGSGCSNGAAGGTPLASVAVSEHDFHIKEAQKVSAGKVDLAVHNGGPDAHELIVVRGHSQTLPMRNDGITVNEEALTSETVGVLEPGNPGARRNLVVNLKPGHYVLFCNMYGHYRAGMHTDLVVQ
ncbi:MAG: hypothetical protein QOJ01_158 [Solirubrobacterales bacterium]|nr:hypothetical protein [Solirubrobacterales bacterium]